MKIQHVDYENFAKQFWCHPPDTQTDTQTHRHTDNSVYRTFGERSLSARQKYTSEVQTWYSFHSGTGSIYGGYKYVATGTTSVVMGDSL